MEEVARRGREARERFEAVTQERLAELADRLLERVITGSPERSEDDA